MPVGSTAYPACLVNVLLLRHLLTYAIGIAKRPGGKLLENANFGESVHVVELFGLFIDSEGVALRGLGDVLAARILIEYLQTGQS